MSQVSLVTLGAVLACSCSAGGGGVERDGAAGETDSNCGGACLLRWWIRENGECTSFCQPPEAAECLESDCQLLEVRAFRTDGTFHTLFPVTHSTTAASLTALLPDQVRAWHLDDNCAFEIDGVAMQSPACTEAELTFTGVVYGAASSPVGNALDRVIDTGVAHQAY